MVQLAIVLTIVCGFVISLVGGLTWVSQAAVPKAEPVDPEQLLARRFASGEIDEKEYARRLWILRYGPPLELF